MPSPIHRFYPVVRSTTIVGMVRDGKAALGGDGQVTFDTTVVKHHARKVRRVYEDQVLCGFAGAAADAFTLFDRFELKLDETNGNLPRAAVELAKDWRTDRYLRRLEAMLAVLDTEHAFLISGTGDVIEPDDGILTIGSGGPYALAAARALAQNTKMPVRKIVEKALEITSDICIFTNKEFMIEEL